MKVMMIGGPCDNKFADVKGDEWDPPVPIMKIHHPLESLATPVSEEITPLSAEEFLVYKLERVDTSPYKWHYEYHYQGR